MRQPLDSCEEIKIKENIWSASFKSFCYINNERKELNLLVKVMSALFRTWYIIVPREIGAQTLFI